MIFRFLNYEFSVIEEVKPQEEEINIPKRNRKIRVKPSRVLNKQLKKSYASSVHDRSEVEQLIESENLMQNEETEERMLKWLDKC